MVCAQTCIVALNEVTLYLMNHRLLKNNDHQFGSGSAQVGHPSNLNSARRVGGLMCCVLNKINTMLGTDDPTGFDPRDLTGILQKASHQETLVRIPAFVSSMVMSSIIIESPMPR